MFKTIKNAWSLPDLRKKILFTLLIIVVFRIGSVIQVPFLDTAALRSVMNPDDWSNTMLSYMNTLSGGAFSNATLFAMGITPYINSSIIIQLLCVAIPPLERLAREAGRRKISAITRYVTVGLGIIQGTAYYFYLLNSKVTLYNSGFELWFSAIVIILVFTAGTAVMMWLGEQINSHGIGNGISILLFAGIVAQFPQIINTLGQYWNLAVNGSTQFFFLVPLWVVLFVAVVWIITFMQENPDSVCKACCGQKDVRRSVKPPSYQGCSRRRSSNHLCKLNSFNSKYNQPLPQDSCRRRLLGCVLCSIQHHRLAVHGTLFLVHYNVRLFLYINSVQPC